ncbi:hypothetical protein JXA05_04240 [Candidatus Peregrinibacteria bacterium]|nr:hypothetical protein [Candidatus Peregrinibacteria bacterium]
MVFKPDKTEAIKGADLVAPNTDAKNRREEDDPNMCEMTGKPIIKPVRSEDLQDLVDERAKESPNKTIRRLRNNVDRTLN